MLRRALAFGIGLGNENGHASAFRSLVRQRGDLWRTPRAMWSFAVAVGSMTSLTTSASAEERWTRALKIPEVLVVDTNTTAIIADVDNPAACSVPSFLRIAKTESNYESITAAILSAQALGRTVRFFAAACYPDGSVHITGLWIQQQ